LILALLTLLLMPAAVYLNFGPYREYAEAQERLQAKEQEVSLLEQEIAALEEEMRRLGDESYLEALARKDLTYARPGEDVFIVKGLPEAVAAAEEEPFPVEPGPMERAVRTLRDLF
jgi:cell division protein FtsB